MPGGEIYYNGAKGQVKDMIVGIIGGGASGMAAALAASEQPGTQVLLLERQARLGRKLHATGNGRCNLTNLHAAPGCYMGSDGSFADSAIAALPPEKTLQWFAALGLLTVAEPSGRVYPYSDQANSVVDVLRLALEKPNISVHTGFEVKKLRREGEGFLISDGEQTHLCDRVVVACGGLAGSALGGTMAGYKLLGKLGHTCTRLRPALVQVKSDWGGIAALKGVRANCHVQILHDGVCFSQSTGELQFTQWGLSGPVIFEISRDVCQAKGQWTAKLDLLPQLTEEKLLAMLAVRQATDLLAEELLTGILHNRLGRVLCKTAGIHDKTPIRALPREALEAVCQTVKAFEISLTEPMGMDSAQVTAGGVETEGFDPRTMESRLIPGLYACGEVLDIDGACGGYNLQWAWSSGYCAGSHAGKETQ